MQPGDHEQGWSTETGERVAAGRYAHRRSKQTQVPSGGTLLSQPADGGAADAATQRFGRHGSSHAQSLSFAHEAAAEVGPPDGADGMALGPAPGSGLAAPLPGVAACSAGVTAAVVVAGGAVGGGAGVELLQATIVRLATMARRAADALRIVQGVASIAVQVSRRVDAMRRGPATDVTAPFDVLGEPGRGPLTLAGGPDRGRPSSGRTAPGWFRRAPDSRGLRLVAFGVTCRQDGSATDIVTGGAGRVLRENASSYVRRDGIAGGTVFPA